MSTKNKKIIFYILFLLFSFIIPILVIFIKYNLFSLFWQTNLKNKITVVISCIVIAVGFYYRVPIKNFLDRLPLSVFKFLVEGAKNTAILIGALILLVNIILRGSPEDLTFIAGWILGSNIVSLFIWEPLWKHYEKLEVKENEKRISEN